MKKIPCSEFFEISTCSHFYKFSPCSVFTGIFAQYFPNFYAQYFSEFSRSTNSRAQPLRFFTTGFPTNSSQQWEVYFGPVLTRDSCPFEYYCIRDFYRYIWIHQFSFNTNILRHCLRHTVLSVFVIFWVAASWPFETVLWFWFWFWLWIIPV